MAGSGLLRGLMMSAVADETMWIKLNNGDVVERPYREAVRLLSRRLADVATDEDREAVDTQEAPVAEPTTEPTTAAEPVDLAAYEEAYSGDELRELAKTNDLPTSGNKGELVARLLEANVELSAAPVAGATPEDVPGENVSSPDELD